MVKLSPQEKMTEFFGLYACWKVNSLACPRTMSLILAFTDSLQYAMISIVLFNLIGIVGMYLFQKMISKYLHLVLQLNPKLQFSYYLTYVDLYFFFFHIISFQTCSILNFFTVKKMLLKISAKVLMVEVFTSYLHFS